MGFSADTVDPTAYSPIAKRTGSWNKRAQAQRHDFCAAGIRVPEAQRPLATPILEPPGLTDLPCLHSRVQNRRRPRRGQAMRAERRWGPEGHGKPPEPSAPGSQLGPLGNKTSQDDDPGSERAACSKARKDGGD